GQTRGSGPYDDNCIICRTKKRLDEAVSWLRLGADLRYRFYRIDNIKLDKKHPDHEILFQRPRARIWAKITPLENLELNVRLMGEPRYWCKPDSKDKWTHCEAFLDQLNVRWRKAFGLPLTLTVGRQDFKFGEGWVLRDGAPLDGGRSTFFDAIRATWDASEIQTTFDLIYIHNHANVAWLHRALNDRDFDIAEHDEQGAVFYVSNKSLKGHTLDAYFIYKNDEKVSSKGWDADIYSFGLRAKGAIDENWQYRAEIIPQFGYKNDTSLCALGSNNELAYHFNDKWKNVLRTQYEYRSGHPHTQDGAFDILWGRWYQGSNLWHFYVATLEAVMAAPSNYHRVSLGWGAKPTKKWWFNADYHLLFRDRNTFSGRAGFSDGGCFRGQLITGIVGYKQNEHVDHHLMLDLFFPGDYYTDARNDAAFFLKYQVVFTW
ncbi:MAG: alginate export family protein, partial [Phycisphaerae bacterium]